MEPLTDEQKNEIRQATDDFVQRVETMYHDMIFEFELKYGWTSDEAEEYFDRFA